MKRIIPRLSLTLLLMFFSILLVSSCSTDDEYLGSRPPTFVGTLAIQPKGRKTKVLYQQLIKLGEKHGLKSYGDGATDDVNWQIQVYCQKNYTAGAVTARAGDLVLFNVSAYGFERKESYENYKSEMLAAMDQFGVITRQEETQPMSQQDLRKREKYMKLDLTSKCR